MKNWIIFSLVAIAIGGVIVSCEQTQDVFSDRKTRDNAVDIRQYLATNKINADSTTSGMYYYIQNTSPNAQKPQVGDEITLSYVARRLDGVIVDSSSTAYPYKYIRVPGLTTNTYRFAPVPSLEELMTTGIEKLHEGDKITLFVPWSLRNAGSATLLAPLYVPLRYDIIIKNIRTEDEQIEDYIKYRGFKITEKASNGLRFGTLQAYKDSTKVKIGDVVTVAYLGRLASNNYQFDPLITSTLLYSTLNVTIADTATSNAGGSVVKGFNDGIFRLKYGEKGVIIFPSALGYGVNPKGTIPAYSPLFFEITATRPL
jgi:FKBP-type peptidyl-prolyl cis-trans isomerase